MSKKNSFFRLEMLFLKVLDRKDCYGYEITHSLKEITHGKIDVKEGTLYPILYKFEELGYITSEKKLVGKRMTRVYYHLEPSGKEYLDNIYSEYKDIVNTINEFMEGSYE
ncbi:MAG: PadR family transcriptional regulator [Bacilli bacterium]|nr:PadR family transcriptional regulator [Bacilli bacterium]